MPLRHMTKVMYGSGLISLLKLLVCSRRHLTNACGRSRPQTVIRKMTSQTLSYQPYIELDVQEPPWMKIARDERGVRAFGQDGSNPRITEYHAGTNIEGYNDKVSWCSSFVHWSLARVSIDETFSALARSWFTWGTSQ